jgi:hypothetical protein
MGNKYCLRQMTKGGGSKDIEMDERKPFYRR